MSPRVHRIIKATEHGGSIVLRALCTDTKPYPMPSCLPPPKCIYRWPGAHSDDIVLHHVPLRRGLLRCRRGRKASRPRRARLAPCRGAAAGAAPAPGGAGGGAAGGWAKGESVEVLAVASAASASTYLRPQRWLPVTRSGPTAKARRRDNMLPVEGMWGVGLGVNCGVKASEKPLIIIESPNFIGDSHPPSFCGRGGGGGREGGRG